MQLRDSYIVASLSLVVACLPPEADPTTADPGTAATTAEPSTTATTTAPTTTSDETTTTGTADTTATGDSTSDGMSTCGDGQVDVGEACDDANGADGDGCSAQCTLECPALHFAGDSFVQAADSAGLHTESVTLALWHRAAIDAPYGVVASKLGDAPAGHHTYSIGTGATGIFARLQTGAGLDFLDLSAPDIKPDGAWHHIALSYDAAR